MFHRKTAATRPGPMPSLSMVDTYDGYVLTQGRHAMADVVLLERGLRFVGLSVAVAIAATWMMPGGTASGDAMILKLALSLVLIALSGGLLWVARVRPQYETRIDLIHRKVTQVLRAAAGAEQQTLQVALDDIDCVFVRRNRAVAVASCLFARLRGCDEPVLLGVGDETALAAVHRRMSGDLHTARLAAAPSGESDQGSDIGRFQPA